MKAVYKYTMTEPNEHILMPKGAQILSAGIQNEIIVVWALVDPSRPPEARRLTALNTGDDTHICGFEYIAHIDTCVSSNGIVWHIFEIKEGFEKKEEEAK